MPNAVKMDTPSKKANTSSQVNTTFTLADVMRKLKLMDDKLSSYESKFSIINNTLTNMQASISILRDENAVMREELGKLRNKVTQFESNPNINNMYSPEELIIETQNRLDKSNNVIILNVAELPDESIDMSTSIAKDMLTDLNLDLNIVQAKRLGKTRPNGRPLLIKFENGLSVRTILKCKSKLRSMDKWKNVWVNADLTRSQQFQMNSLRETLRQKRKDGDLNLVIKYVNGVPTICPKN